MRHTLKAIFDRRSDAQHVLDKLLASGYSHADTTPTGIEHDEGFGTSVRHTFARMFGTTHHEDVEPPRDDDASAQHVVIFTSESAPEAERAAGIIGDFGPNGIEEHQENSDRETAGAYLPGVAAMRTIYPPGTAPGSLQFRAPEDSPYFGTQNAESPPTGNTFQNRMGTTPWANPDEGASDAGTVHPWPEAGSNDDTAAYRYGEEMRASDPSAARSWEETEPILQSDWEHKRKDAELPAWHRIKEAVRRGWERVKH